MSKKDEKKFRQNYIEVIGAREHNLKNINVSFPRDKFVVITGISGSGKSSLAFDTIYAEGQRRYMESFTAYARNFIGNISRPEVDKIEGLSPVIAIEQKTTGRNPRSTVGTLTEIYDFLRLLYSKIGRAYSYNSGKEMSKQTEEEVLNQIFKKFYNNTITILGPIIKGRKGHYKELLKTIQTKGYNKARIDGEIISLTKNIQLDRYKIHNIEIVIDRILINNLEKERLKDSLKTAFKEGKGSIIISIGNKLYYYSKYFMDLETGLSYDEPAPNTFSFNSPLGACPKCNGLGEEIVININNIIPNKNLNIKDGGIAPLGKWKNTWQFKIIESILKNEQLDITKPIKSIPENIINKILYGTKETVLVEYNNESWNSKFKGVLEYLKKKARNKDTDTEEEFVYKKICSLCNGDRLKKESLHFKIGNKNISELANLNINLLYSWLNNINDKLNEREKIIAEEPLKEIKKRIKLILDIGLDYLHLNRSIGSLSGGEAQRIRLATQIGNQLVSVLYILDEPSIGLHQRDNFKLIKALKELRDKGNSILVVEHDKDIMLNSDYIIDIGPGAGKLGGQVVSEGEPKEFLNKNGITAQFLKGTKKIETPHTRREGNGKFINIKNCQGHNLKNVNLKLPLEQIVCITGVSGSGKSTLIHETLSAAIRKELYRSSQEPLKYEKIEGIENIDKLVEIDQNPIGRTPRSNAVTYTGVFTSIRNIFTNIPEAKVRGYKPGRFSFNVKGGRCETCEGAGIKILEMDFLPSVKVSCETCRGKRYNRQTLEVRYKGKSIADILEMTVDQAVEFFEKYPKISKVVKTLQDVGLGYISLGQHATTISGGEAQRVKLATELSKRDTGNTLYILDEPSTGLHFQDIQHLLNVLNRLADKGNTVLIIEHNLDIIKIADYIIDIGLEGGNKGGEIIVEGTPEEVIKNKISYTAKYLKQELNS
ncbi:MAG: excinuclease ABC subunit UvrA [Bacteroidetes bacterium]|nr:excinuclease ABC subunit UvrA [Bacteroidota bacterium]